MGGSLISFVLAIVILGIFQKVHSKFKILEDWNIPPSLSASILMLVVIAVFPKFKESLIYKDWQKYPSEFMALIFAGLFIKVLESEKKSETLRILAQTSFVWVAILGQILLGIVLTLILFQPVFGLPIYFSSILEAGFAGGHGTAINLVPFFDQYGFKEGKEFALFSATMGILFGIVGGILLIRKDSPKSKVEDISNSILNFKVPEFLTNLSLVFVAYSLGYILFQLDSISDGLTPIRIPTLPLFFYTLLGGLLLKFLLKKTKKESWINNDILSLFANLFMEIMIFTALSTMDVNIITGAILPLLLLFTIGFLWNVFCYIYWKDKFFPKEYSKEIGILNFGMLNGTTAIGMALLKMINPKLDTPAIQIYAESAAFTAPFIGGGIITLQMPHLLTKYSPWMVSAIILLTMVFFYGLGILSHKRSEKKK